MNMFNTVCGCLSTQDLYIEYSGHNIFITLYIIITQTYFLCCLSSHGEFTLNIIIFFLGCLSSHRKQVNFIILRKTYIPNDLIRLGQGGLRLATSYFAGSKSQEFEVIAWCIEVLYLTFISLLVWSQVTSHFDHAWLSMQAPGWSIITSAHGILYKSGIQ